MNIYFDLDETLIQSILGRPGMGLGKRTKITASEGETYHVLIRPLAEQMLKTAKEITGNDPRILTSSKRCYAHPVCQLLTPEIKTEHITAFEDYTFIAQTAYGGKDYVVTDIKTDPTAILIDNLPYKDPIIRGKCLFLGIPPENCIQIREFYGKDPEKFATQEWPAIQQRIQKIHKETQNQ